MVPTNHQQWFVKDTPLLDNQHHYSVVSKDGTEVCAINAKNGATTLEQLAHAKLISQAPELERLLEGALHLIHEFIESNILRFGESTDVLMQHARQTLREATGKAIT